MEDEATSDKRSGEGNTFNIPVWMNIDPYLNFDLKMD